MIINWPSDRAPESDEGDGLASALVIEAQMALREAERKYDKVLADVFCVGTEVVWPHGYNFRRGVVTDCGGSHVSHGRVYVTGASGRSYWQCASEMVRAVPRNTKTGADE